MSNKLALLVLGLVLVSLLAASCAKQPAPTVQGPTPPAHVAKSPPADAGTTAQAKVEYTCSMHPEVISDKPGKCPKCGMDLIEKKGSTAPTASAEVKDWSCPKHPGKLYAKGEKCEVCGGDLKELAPGEKAPPGSESAVASKLPIGNEKGKDGSYICPVMKNPIKDLKTAEHLELGGKVWYFCCPGCPDQFKADPKKYAPDIAL